MNKSELIARARRLEKCILADSDPWQLAADIMDLRKLGWGLNG